MKKIVAVNCSPRTAWNTATLVRDAAKGAEEHGAKIEVIDLYKLEKFTAAFPVLAVSCPRTWASVSAETVWHLSWMRSGMQTV